MVIKVPIWFSALLCLLAVNFAQAQKAIPFQINGTIAGQQTGYVSLTYIDHHYNERIDSVGLTDGTFHFEGLIPHPVTATLRGEVKSIADDDLNAVGLYLDSGTISIDMQKHAFKNAAITGSKTQVESERLSNAIHALKNISREEIEAVAKNFIIENPASYVSGFELLLWHSQWPVDTVIVLFSLLSPEVKNSFYGKKLSQKIAAIESALEGSMAASFTAVDLNGRSIALTDFKGRYVLLDFWASWCLPCRDENPTLIKIYKKYHSRGLEIISIADDDFSPDAWKSAIEQDGTGAWYHVLRNKSKGDSGTVQPTSDLSGIYGVSTLPTKILIDNTGRIVYNTKYSQKTDLETLLSSLLGEPTQ